MTDIEDRLPNIPHKHLDLEDAYRADNSPHRPKLSVWSDWQDEDGARVVLSIAALWGQQRRFIEMGPLEARKLARLLSDMADAVDREIEGAVT